MLITNNGKLTHKHIIGNLIVESKICILCTGWINLDGLNAIEEYISKTNANEILLYSNSRAAHTPKAVKDKLKTIKKVRHFLAKDSHKTLHSKIYYFENDNAFTAVIGSANLTGKGLSTDEELSVLITGDLKTDEHVEILNYLKQLNVHLKHKG